MQASYENRVCRDPQVELVGYTTLEPEGLALYLNGIGQPGWQSDAEVPAQALVEAAGRLCYLSYQRPRPGGNTAYIARLIAEGHESVLEHASFTLMLAGVSRSLTHELVRHRHMSFSQTSQRYVDASKARVVMPPALLLAPETVQQRWCRDALAAVATYQLWVTMLTHSAAPGAELPLTLPTPQRKMIYQTARSLLPNCVEAPICVTANARAWRHFLRLRGTLAADLEMRRLAVEVYRVLADTAPTLFDDLSLEPSPTDPWMVVRSSAKAQQEQSR